MILVASDCGGSSYTQALLRALLAEHKIRTAGDFEEVKRFVRGGFYPDSDFNYTTECQGKSSEEAPRCAFKEWRKTFEACSGVADARHPFTKVEFEYVRGSLPLAKELASTGSRVVVVKRNNTLDLLTCEVRDCFWPLAPKTGFASVNTDTGEKSSLCYERRSSTEVTIQAKMNTDHLIDIMTRKAEGESSESAVDALVKGGMKREDVAVAMYEELSAYEYSGPDLNARVQLSKKALARLLRDLGVTPKEDVIEQYLRRDAGTRTKEGQSDTIYNFDEVKQVLQGSKFEFTLDPTMAPQAGGALKEMDALRPKAVERLRVIKERNLDP
jgi:hypothetical protein